MKPGPSEHKELIEQIISLPGVTPALLERCRYHLQRKLGVCSRRKCTAPTTPGGSLCAEHRDAQQAHTREHRRLKRDVKKYLDEQDGSCRQ